MEDKELKDWLEMARDFHSTSTTYLDNNYRSQWEDNIRLYQNRHPKRSKYNSELYQRRSRIFRPKTRSAGQKFEAAVSNAYFATKDIITLTPENTRDPEQKASAIINTNLLNYRLTKTIPWFKICIGAAQEAWKMGVVASYQSWVYEEDEDGNIIKDEPRIELIPPENLRIDKASDWLDPINTSPYLIREIPMYIYEVKKRIKGNEFEKTGQPKWNEVEDSKFQTAYGKFYDSIRVEREKRKTDPKSNNETAFKDYDLVWIHENIIQKDGKDWIFYTLGTETILSEPVPLESVYFHGKRPYTLGGCLLEPFKVYPQGIPELTQDLQEEINDVANMRLDNVKLVLNKRYFAKRGRNVDYRSLLRNVAGSITLMDNPLEDVNVISTPDITASSYAEQDRLNVDYDELAGNFSSGSVQTNRRMSETVGGMSMIASGAGQITEHYIKIFNETWVEPTIRQIILLEQMYETDGTVLAVSANKEMESLYQEFGLNPILDELLRSELTLNINVGISSTNPQNKVEKFLFAMDSLGRVLASPIAGTLEIKEVVNEIFGLLGYKDATRFFKDFDGNGDPRIQQLMGEVQRLTQVIEQKQIEENAKMVVKNAELSLKSEELKLKALETQSKVQQDQVENEDIIASARKKLAETEQIISGIDIALKSSELQLKDKEINTKVQSDFMKNKTERDKIVADLIKAREELEGKLKITLANKAFSPSGGGGISNNITDLKQPVNRQDGGPLEEGQVANVAEDGKPEVFVGESGDIEVLTQQSKFRPDEDGFVLSNEDLKGLTPRGEVRDQSSISDDIGRDVPNREIPDLEESIFNIIRSDYNYDVEIEEWSNSYHATDNLRNKRKGKKLAQKRIMELQKGLISKPAEENLRNMVDLVNKYSSLVFIAEMENTNSTVDNIVRLMIPTYGVETNFGTSIKKESSTGALGEMQVLPSTFVSLVESKILGPKYAAAVGINEEELKDIASDEKKTKTFLLTSKIGNYLAAVGKVMESRMAKVDRENNGK